MAFWRIVRRIAFGTVGAGLGGFVGKEVGEKVSDALDWGENLEAGIRVGLEAGSAGAGGVMGDALHGVVESHIPPSNPKKGTVWRNPRKNQYYEWNGYEWIPFE